LEGGKQKGKKFEDEGNGKKRGYFLEKELVLVRKG